MAPGKRGPSKQPLKSIRMGPGMYKRTPEQSAEQTKARRQKRVRHHVAPLVDKGIYTPEEAENIVQNYEPCTNTSEHATAAVLSQVNSVHNYSNMTSIATTRSENPMYFPYARIDQPSRSSVQLARRNLTVGMASTIVPQIDDHAHIATLPLETVIALLLEAAQLPYHTPTAMVSTDADILRSVRQLPRVVFALTTDGATLDTQRSMQLQLLKLIDERMVWRVQQPGMHALPEAGAVGVDDDELRHQSPRCVLLTGFSLNAETAESSFRYTHQQNCCLVLSRFLP